MKVFFSLQIQVLSAPECALVELRGIPACMHVNVLQGLG